MKNTKKQISRKSKAKSGISISRNKYETRLIKDLKENKNNEQHNKH